MKRKPHTFKFELRIYSGEAEIPENFITKISYQFKSFKGEARAKTIEAARRFWAGCIYPNDANVESLGLWMEPCEIELLLETAKMLEGLDYCYGLLVRLPCPTANFLPGCKLYEFRHAPEGTVVPSGFQVMYAPQIVAR
jgi:hypothetical protein